MLFNMANPEAANPEDIQNAMAPQEAANEYYEEEEDQANMIAALSGMQLGGENQEGAMTQQEIDDMRMA